ncbi:MAG: four helix bundle protein [Lutibacter sp.]|nr:four helix bundle protein [Lutibacter sp.]MDT8416406.1 four helix bundle protein [Lutibacter sp.]
MHNFKELDIWNEAKNFSILVYKATSKFPNSEILDYRLKLRERLYQFRQILRREQGEALIRIFPDL